MDTEENKDKMQSLQKIVEDLSTNVKLLSEELNDFRERMEKVESYIESQGTEVSEQMRYETSDPALMQYFSLAEAKFKQDYTKGFNLLRELECLDPSVLKIVCEDASKEKGKAHSCKEKALAGIEKLYSEKGLQFSDVPIGNRIRMANFVESVAYPKENEIQAIRNTIKKRPRASETEQFEMSNRQGAPSDTLSPWTSDEVAIAKKVRKDTVITTVDDDDEDLDTDTEDNWKKDPNATLRICEDIKRKVIQHHKESDRKKNNQFPIDNLQVFFSAKGFEVGYMLDN